MPDHTEYETGARKLQGMPDASSTKKVGDPEKDAEGQSETHHSGGSNDGVSSANPRVLSGNEDGDATFPFEKPKDEEPRTTPTAGTGYSANEPDQSNDGSIDDKNDTPSFPPFDDPANSPRPAGSPVAPTAAVPAAPPEDTQYAGHPDFSQDAAGNKPPKGGMGLTRPLGENSAETRQSDARGPSVASSSEEISKDDVDHRPL